MSGGRFGGRPTIFALIAGLLSWIYYRPTLVLAASNYAFETWQIIYFWLALQLTAAVVMVCDGAAQKSGRAIGDK